jgi:membrane-associated HD superfamily phosphohydrolase
MKESESNPFDDLFDQINSIISFVKKGELASSEDDKIPPEIEKKLEDLHRKVDMFTRISEDIVNLSGVSKEELKLRLNGTSKEVPEDGQRLIERGQEIMQEAEKVNEKLEETLKFLTVSDQLKYRAISSAVPDAPKNKVVSDEDYTKKRRSKFKRFGSDKNWKPL